MSTSPFALLEQSLPPVASAAFALESIRREWRRERIHSGGIFSCPALDGERTLLPFLVEGGRDKDTTRFYPDAECTEFKVSFEVDSTHCGLSSIEDAITLLRGGDSSPPHKECGCFTCQLAFVMNHHSTHRIITPPLQHGSLEFATMPFSPRQIGPLEGAVDDDDSQRDTSSTPKEIGTMTAMINQNVYTYDNESQQTATRKKSENRRFRFRWFRIRRKARDALEGKSIANEQVPRNITVVSHSQGIPIRFLRAAKGDPVLARRRFQKTLQWRQQYNMDTILNEPHFHFEFIKQHYPHFFHLRGRNSEPVYYESPAKTNLKALRQGNVTLEILLRHYAMVTEFTWQYVERNDLAQSIYIIDLEGVTIRDFVGECVEFVRKACAFCNQHYPERSGCIFVIHVPSYFQLIWRVVKKFADKKTLAKVKILRDQEEILEALLEKIALENIPPEYGGTSMPLGEAPEEKLLCSLMKHNNHRAFYGTKDCGGKERKCPFCTFEPARSY